MYPLVLLSIYTVGVAILKIIQFKKTNALSNGFAQMALLLIKNHEADKAEKILLENQNPLGKVMLTALTQVRSGETDKDAIEQEIERVGTNEVRELETHLKGLEMTSNISPLLGLLGTVIGMVNAFANIAGSGSRVDPSMLAGGIWEALITTVGGLVVAVPAVAAFYIIDGLIDKIRAEMKDNAVQIVAMKDKLRTHSAKPTPIKAVF
jgi:biopolymer transport protein ExbB